MEDDKDDEIEEKADSTAALEKRAEQAAAAKKKAEGVGDWIQDTLADFQPYLQKISEVRQPMPLHRMDPELAHKILDYQREIRLREIDAGLAKHERETKSALVQHEQNIARDDRHEFRLGTFSLLLLLIGGGLAVACVFLGQASLANGIITALVSILTLLINKMVRAARRSRRLQAAQPKSLREGQT